MSQHFDKQTPPDLINLPKDDILDSISDSILSVSQFTAAMQSHVESRFHHIRIRGEISNLKMQASGHIYFSLTDGKSLLNAVVFRSYATPAIQKLRDGDEIVAAGEISIYAPRGSYQLVIRNIRQEGQGLELIRLEKLKKKLQDLGWSLSDHKKTIPQFWKTVVVITSPTGAVIRDILTVLDRKMRGRFHLLVYPVRVQGSEASAEIAAAIQHTEQYAMADLIIICRGGGGSDDMAPFNTEIVAAAVFNSRIPIISAVGHETDTTIIDLVADVRAPTPSIAAELISEPYSLACDKIATIQKALLQRMRLILKEFEKRTAEKRKALSSPERLVELYSQKLDDLSCNIATALERTLEKIRLRTKNLIYVLQIADPKTRLAECKNRIAQFPHKFFSGWIEKQHNRRRLLVNLEQQVRQRARELLRHKRALLLPASGSGGAQSLIQRILVRHRTALTALERARILLNPKLPLEKGYSLLFQKEHLVHSVYKIDPSAPIRILLRDGEVEGSIDASSIRS